MILNDLKQKLKPCVSLKSWQTLTLLATLPLLLAAKCNPDAPQIALKAQLWNADSQTQSIVRQFSPGVIQQVKCADTAFDTFLCTTQSEYMAEMKRLETLSYQCEKWKPGTKLDMFGLPLQQDGAHAQAERGDTND